MDRRPTHVLAAAFVAGACALSPAALLAQDDSRAAPPGAAQQVVAPASMQTWHLRNWMAYTSPYADVFLVSRDEHDQPLGSFLMPMRLRTPELLAGSTAKIGFYIGGDAGVRFRSELVEGGSRVDSHRMFSGIAGGYLSGLNNPVIDKVDVGFNSLGQGIGLELTGKAFGRSGRSVTFAIVPKTLIYAVTPTEGSRGYIWYANAATHWMFGRFMINIDPGMIRLPDGEILVAGRVGVPLPKGFLVFAGVPANLPMEYQDVLPGAHPTPGDVEVGFGKGPVQFGVGTGRNNITYGFFRLSVRPAQVGNRSLRPQGDGHVMLSPDAEASHQGHGPNSTPPRAQVSVEEDLTVPPASLLELVNDPLLKEADPRLVFDQSSSTWQLGFRHTHRMMVRGQMSDMTMWVNTDVPKLLELLTDPSDAMDGNSPAALARIRGYYEARVREIISEMRTLSEDKSVTPGDRANRVERLYKEGTSYGVLSEELQSQYRSALRN